MSRWLTVCILALSSSVAWAEQPSARSGDDAGKAETRKAKPKQAKPKQAKPKQAKPKQAKPKQAKPKVRPKRAQSDQTQPPSAHPAAPGAAGQPRPARGLDRMAAELAAQSTREQGAPTPVGAQRLDLTPARLFGKGTVKVKSDRRGSEKTSGLSLGDDSDWRVQAAQIGVMAAGFAALVGLCGGGKCMLPNAGPFKVEQGPSPDVQIRQNSEPRPDPR